MFSVESIRGAFMRKITAIPLVVLFGCLAGCCGVGSGVPNAAIPVVVDNGTQSRVLVPCTDDTLCVRNTYEVTKDVWCTEDRWFADQRCRRDYPVSYRSKNWEYETNKVEYIYMPRTLVVQ